MGNATDRTPTAAESTPFIVVLRAEGAGPPVAIRLRRWLKTALRSHGLRAISVREATTAAQGQTLPNDSPLGRPAGSEAPRGNVVDMASG
jgi:hypothetical protein